MTMPHAQPSPTSVRAASAAVAAVFVLNGFNFSTWAARLPAVRDALDVGAGQMGLLLLFGAFGAIAALPTTGLVVGRLGAARTVLSFAVVNAAGYLLAAVGLAMGQVPVVAAALLLVGVGTGVWDATMNLEGALVEQRLGRTVMPRYHAGFSFGTVGAAGIAAVLARLDVPVQLHIAVAVVVSTIAVAVASRYFLPSGPAEHDASADGPGRSSVFTAWLEPRTLLIGLVILAAALTEGAGNDWLSLAVVDGFERDESTGAMVFALFVTAMTVMRLLGTRLLDRYGRVAVLQLCSALALVGLLLFGLVPADRLWLTLVGAVLWGMGAALGFPVGMSAASDDPLRAAARVAVVSTVGYTAFLAGPPLLGLLAEHVGYRHALLVIVAPILLGLVVVKAAAPPHAEQDERPTLVP